LKTALNSFKLALNFLELPNNKCCHQSHWPVSGHTDRPV